MSPQDLVDQIKADAIAAFKREMRVAEIKRLLTFANGEWADELEQEGAVAQLPES